MEGLNDIYQGALELRNKEKIKELKSHFKISLYFVAPIYLLFWFCDWMYAPDQKWYFFLLRLLIIPASALSYYLNEKMESFEKLQLNVLFFAFVNSAIITVMIFMTGFGDSPYYAGLNLVCVGTYGFVPWSRRFLSFPFLAFYAPYFGGCLIFNLNQENFNSIIINSFFILGTTALSLIIYFFKEKIQVENCISRLRLKKEIEDRNKVIKEKTEESIKFQNLSQQFSPQVVKAIQNGKIHFDKSVHRAKICAIFIDIVNSTERVTRIDEDKVNKVISLFMEDCNKILLKYDITIDKFLGDGILAFSNDPVKYDDYVLRVVLAAIEIRDKIKSRNYIYENYWLKELEIRIGIAQGYANIGFYGHEEYFRSYTAIGPVINLASRLCSVARPDQIVATYDVVESLNIMDFEVEALGQKTLKGFESDKIKLFSLSKNEATNFSVAGDSLECPKCKNLMHVDTNLDGHFIFGCRECGFIKDQLDNKLAI